MNKIKAQNPTIAELLQAAKAQLGPLSASASLDAQVVLCEVLGVGRAYLLAHGEQALTVGQARRFEQLIARRATGEPLAYIIERRAFYDRDFYVSPAVLIPRPETELLLERALEYIRQRSEAIVVDVGTGSGALAVTLAAHCPNTSVYATDCSPKALAVARYNASLNHVEITFCQGDLLQPLIVRAVEVDLLLANLPYIATDELAELEVGRYEPHIALDGGPDGLDMIRRLLEQAPRVLKSGGLILLEIGARQGQAVLDLVDSALTPHATGIVKDYAGHDRIVWAER